MRFLLFALFTFSFAAQGAAPDTNGATTRGASALPQGSMAKWEPLTGCYIGAFIEREPTLHGDIALFEALTKKKHASYFTYVGFGQPFPE